MNRFKIYALALFIGVLAFVVSTHAQEQKKDDHATHQHEEKATYTCEMHPEVKSDKPGKCPKCGMNLVLASELQTKQVTAGEVPNGLSAKEKVLKAKQLLEEAKNELYYNCCIKEPCDRCALDHQSCNCNRDLREGKGICADCYAGWQLGQGKNIKGITKEKVKPNFHGHKH
ncbi:MAG: hypothetical protein HYZ01_06315 [Ignavibacteriales bacterium]|nr:hypothetical protein [Ignavibacteriales bacterium]